MSDTQFVPLVRVLRENVLESVHHGVAVIVDHEGENCRAWGDASSSIIMRSTGKPFQAANLIESGVSEALHLNDREIAVAVGSHGGTPTQIAVVQSLMCKGDVDQRMLKCGTHPPFDRAARTLSRRGGPTMLQNNCSGKHAAMLAAVIHRGLPVETYLHPANPYQREIRELLAGAIGVEAESIETVTDGCGAPSFVLSAHRAAQAYAVLAAATEGSLARIWRAATGQPQMIAGQERLETVLMERYPGRVLAKSGAEGVYALAARTDAGPRGALIKIADGDDRRARTAVAIALAGELLGLPPGERRALHDAHVGPVLSFAGRPVGVVESTIP